MTTDPTPLTDDEWRAFQAIPDQGYSHRAWVDHKIAQRVRKAQADAWDEGWKERAKRDVYRSHPHLDRDVPGPPRHLNPHRETEN